MSKKIRADNSKVPTGISGLDDILGGRLPPRTLFSGPPGSGNSNIALTFATKAARDGEKVAIYTFDEGLSVLFARAAGLNFGLDELAEKGMVNVKQIDPAELSPRK